MSIQLLLVMAPILIQIKNQLSLPLFYSSGSDHNKSQIVPSCATGSLILIPIKSIILTY